MNDYPVVLLEQGEDRTAAADLDVIAMSAQTEHGKRRSIISIKSEVKHLLEAPECKLKRGAPPARNCSSLPTSETIASVEFKGETVRVVTQVLCRPK